MTQSHLAEVPSASIPVVSTRELDVAPMPRRADSKPLRFAVSLTDPQGRAVFRKQFATAAEADAFAKSSAELCPDYKVSSVDRVDGVAYELSNHSLTITASPN